MHLGVSCELRGHRGKLPDAPLKLLDLCLQRVVPVSCQEIFHGHTEILGDLERGRGVGNLVFLLPVVESLRNDADPGIKITGLYLPFLHQLLHAGPEIDFQFVNVHGVKVTQ